MSLCIVTAFLDINRDQWNAFSRSVDQYFNNFKPYLSLGHRMIVFMDDKHITEINKMCSSNRSITIIPINRDWMKEHIYAYQQLQRETEIMASSDFRNKVKHRLSHPECSKPEYNIIQHSKIDFVAHVINNQMSSANYYAWSDFGYFQNPNRIPVKGLDLNKFDLTKINFQAINNITPADSDIEYTLTRAPERVGGFFYLGRKDMLLKYQELYHLVCTDFHKMGIVDDDQHIMLQCVFRNKDLFKVWNLGGWHLTYNYFQRD